MLARAQDRVVGLIIPEIRNLDAFPGLGRDYPVAEILNFSSSKSCHPAFKRGMTGRTTKQLSPNGIGCQIQDITKI